MRATNANLLQQLINQPCVEAVAQPETGGDLLVGFGRLVPYVGEPNRKLRATHRSQWTLMILCPWSLKGPSGTEADWTTVADHSANAEAGHRAVIGSIVRSVELSQSDFTLTIRFDDGRELIARCDPSFDECWYLSLLDGTSLVAHGNRTLSKEVPQ